jgi:iron complex outermembrane recepter protein
VHPSQDLTRQVELDLWLRYVSGLSFSDSITGQEAPIRGYLTLDARLAWKPWTGVVGQNLLLREHRESQPQVITTQATTAARGVYGKLDWHF